MLETTIKTNVQNTDVDVDESLKRHVEKRIRAIERLLDLSDTSIICDIELARTTQHHQQGDVFRAEFNLHTARGDFYAAAEKESLATAIDEAQKELRKGIRRKKGKQIDRVRKVGKQLKDFVRGWRRR